MSARREQATLDDPVNKPSHYRTNNDIECIDAILATLGPSSFIDYCRGTAMKYIWRAPHKKNALQDIQKAQRYLKFAENVISGKKPREDSK